MLEVFLFGELVNNIETHRAEIIKIEHPTRGDDTRAWGPPFAKHVRGKDTESPGESAYFLSRLLTPSLSKVNRNKKSIGLSFASESGQSILHSLAKTSDVLVENYLPNTLSKYTSTPSTPLSSTLPSPATAKQAPTATALATTSWWRPKWV
ncbi:MAG: hypothetical protein Q9204_008086 [Flavoplaca sp. TL-2023a]